MQELSRAFTKGPVHLHAGLRATTEGPEEGPRCRQLQLPDVPQAAHTRQCPGHEPVSPILGLGRPGAGPAHPGSLGRGASTLTHCRCPCGGSWAAPGSQPIGEQDGSMQSRK